MNTDNFNKVLDEQLKRCTDVLVNKAKEYATSDRLHNFKVAAALQGITPKEALAGMMAKHTVSTYDMCLGANKEYPISLWNEKITDSINYLLLLRALVEESVAEGKERKNPESLKDIKAFKDLNWEYDTSVPPIATNMQSSPCKEGIIFSGTPQE